MMMPLPLSMVLPLLVASLLMCRAEDVEPSDSVDVHLISPEIYSLKVPNLNGDMVSFDKYRQKVMLIANLASQCGYTASGYKQLNELHNSYYSSGLRVLGFPCNQFGMQEPGSAEEIQQFAKSRGAEFEIFQKVEVNGGNSHDLFKMLRGDHVSDTCRDENTNCQGWAGHGECDANPAYMHVNCRKSCGKCTPKFKFGGDLSWNFEFFLVGSEGHVVNRFRTGTDMLSSAVKNAIEKELAAISHDEL